MKQCIRMYQRCKNPYGNRRNNGKYNRSRMNLFSIDKNAASTNVKDNKLLQASTDSCNA